MSQQGLRFTLDVDGLTPAATAVVSFTLYQNLSTPFLLTVDIASDRSGLTAASFLEKNATLTIWQGAVALRYLHGIITGMETGENNGWQMNYSLTISPPLWRCGLRQNFRIFQQQDILAISTTLLTENGVTDWVPSFYESHPAREFCVQYGETDLGFLIRLWAEEGIFFFDWFHPTSPDQKLVLCDDVAGVSTLGEMSFNPNTREVATECISEFRYRAQVRPSSVENQDYTFKAPGWPAYFSHHAPNLNGQRTQYEIFDWPGRFKDEQHGQDFARYQAEGHRQDAETAACESNSPKLWPGKRFTLTGHPSLTLNREWQVTGSVLKGKQPQAQHGHQGEGTKLSNSLDVIPADRTWRASPLPKPAVDGPQSAIVTGPAGEEIFCDEHGRVRVRFHWDRYCPGNEDSSCWIRVSQAWAGAGFGNLAIPRVGQEVIVDFLNGDPDQPIIMGRTYHQDNRSPGSLPGTKTQMAIRSKTYKGGGFNELRFEDATGQEQVYIHAQKNMDTEVLNNRTTDVKVDHTETIGNNQIIAVGLGQTVTVGKENAGGHDQTLTVAHDRRITVRNDQTLKVKNDRMVSISHDDGLYVANDRKVTVEGKQEHTTTGDHISLVKGSHSLEVKGDLARKVAGALGIKVREAIVLESSGSITLKVGCSFVVIHAGGVDIMGPKINLNSGGSPGTPVQTQQPAVLKALPDKSDGICDAGDTEDTEPPRKNLQDTFNQPPQDLVPPQIQRIFSR
ncbi:type VI secretion system tip protein VgrG [Citrobacter portucalensis]|uniref:type VI secretion system Vgr family protein n=2 Tax=Citrobacter TaxID=544 RepID=UPI00226B0763|nr:type VI secretion system tip protein VgrG [Citrobacter portucalensis]MCX8971734.1 type VI secretion system tip protein VgrG [Citrobacter portucalensis]MCX9038601.1 type VI secretion system tip protein VgrG [Citrobacter portucalensis]